MPFLVSTQLLEFHPTITQLLALTKCVTNLLYAPFFEAAQRVNVIVAHLRAVNLHLTEQGITSKAVTDPFWMLQMELIRQELQLLGPMPQHGSSPGYGSEHLLTDIINKKDTRAAAFTTLDIGSSLQASEIPGQGTFSDNIMELQKRLINMPVNPGEAARLVRCWAQLPEGQGEESEGMIHPLYDLCRLMDITMTVQSHVFYGTATATSATVLEGASPAASSRVGSKQSDMELLEALCMTGMLS